MTSNFNYTGTKELAAMENMLNYNQHILKLLHKAKPEFDRVIDFGAGIGTFAKLIQPNCRELTCLEIDKQQQDELSRMQFQVIDDLNKVPDSSQSLIYSINVLEHIKDDATAVKLMSDKLKPNGKVFFYVPAFNSIYTAMDKKVGHYRRYDKNCMKTLLHNTGLVIEDMHYVDSLGYVAALVFKYCGSKQGDLNIKQLKLYDRLIFPLSCILDKVCKRFIGKNLVVVAVKEAGNE